MKRPALFFIAVLSLLILTHPVESVEAAVTIQSFTAEWTDTTHVTVNWVTATEVNNAGFRLYRSTTNAGPWGNAIATVPSKAGGQVTGASYTYDDDPGSYQTYYYKLQAIAFDGSTEDFGPASATAASSPTPTWTDTPESTATSTNIPSPTFTRTRVPTVTSTLPAPSPTNSLPAPTATGTITASPTWTVTPLPSGTADTSLLAPTAPATKVAVLAGPGAVSPTPELNAAPQEDTSDPTPLAPAFADNAASPSPTLRVALEGSTAKPGAAPVPVRRAPPTPPKTSSSFLATTGKSLVSLALTLASGVLIGLAGLMAVIAIVLYTRRAS